MTKTILCYGDSNTWGFNPADMTRFSATERWGSVLRNQLGADYIVLEEGLNGRTTVWEDRLSPGRNGEPYLLPCLTSHMPLDLVVILLGTNDLKTRYSASAYEIAEGAGRLVEIVQRSQTGRMNQAPEVLLMAPPPICDPSNFGAGDPTYQGFEEAWVGGIEKSQQFATHYQRVATAHGCHFLDTSTVVTSSPLDGIHWEVESHQALGAAVAEQVRKILA